MIAAAGSGERLGAGGPKALVELGGRPMLAWSLDAFAAATEVDRVIVAAPPGYEEQVETAASGSDTAVRIEVVAGGATRAQSVARALDRVEAELVAVHDAARPLVEARLINTIVTRLDASTDVAGVIAAAPLTDTVKRVTAPAALEGGLERGRAVAGTERRELLWAAQTPQAFRTDLLRDAHAAAGDEADDATDDAMLVEAAGGTVLIEPAPPANLKVTTPSDLRIAEALLSGR